MTMGVKITPQVPITEGDTGEEVEVDEARARQLVNGGAALYATKPAAKAAGDDPAKAVTAKKG